VVALAFVVGLVGFVLSLFGSHALGAILMGLSGMSLGACLLLGGTTDTGRG
jgi:hypothetical protein